MRRNRIHSRTARARRVPETVLRWALASWFTVAVIAQTAPAPFDNTDPAIAYTGTWMHDANWPMAFNASVSYTNVPGSALTFRFNGDNITYVYNKGPNRGIASVILDAAARPDLDLYSPTLRWQVAVAYSGLGAGSHTIEIRATGRKHARSADSFVDLDRFVVGTTPARPGRYDDGALELSYLGDWARDGVSASRWPAAHNATLSYSNQYLPGRAAPAAVTFTFSGNSITYFHTKAHNRGIAAITIDGVDKEPIDLYAPTGQIEWRASKTFTGLGPGIHNLHISLLPEKNPLSADYFIDVDALHAGYRLDGLNFSPFIDGQDPNHGAQVTEQQIRDRLSLIASDTEWVRSFGSTAGLEHFARIAREFGFKVAAGAWLSRDMAANEREIASLVRAMNGGYVDLAIVGSEVLLRGDLSAQQLIAYMQRVRREAPGIPVTTAEVYGLLNNKELIDASDVLFANFYPYWEGVQLGAAVCSIESAYKSLQRAASSKQVIVSETGWPSCGNPRGNAVPSTQKAAAFLLNFTSWARSNNVRYMYFEALDESWKEQYEGPQGACWGIRDKNGNLKPGVQEVLEGRTAPNEMCGPIVPPNGSPGIEFTHVPPYGSFEDLRGLVRGIQPADVGVVVYIKVGAGWWTKPFANAPVTRVQPDGSWTCDITTGGIDQTASEIIAYLVPIGFQPPVLLGSGTLPAALDQNASAKISVERELPCAYMISPPSRAVLAGQDEGEVAVTSASRCSWTAASNSAWLTVTSGQTGSGSNVVRYSVAPNTSGASRTGTLTVAGQTFSVTQGSEGFRCSQSNEIRYGDTVYCPIATPGATTTYRFRGEPGEAITIQTSNWGGTDFYPCIELIAPDNSRSRDCRLDFYSRLDRVLQQAGTYTIFVTSMLSHATGTYVLALERLVAPSPSAVRLEYSTTVAGESYPAGDLDVFSFEGAPGERITASVATTGGVNYIPCIELIRPDNSRTSACALSLSNRLDALLTQSGTHAIVLRSHYAFAAGTYVLTVHRTVPPSASAPLIRYGVTTTGAIDPPGDIDLFSFEGKAGDSIALVTASLGGVYFEPCIQLIAPTGSVGVACGLALGHRLDRVVSASGTYSVLVFDDASAVAGGRYNLTLNCLAGPCAQPAQTAAPSSR